MKLTAILLLILAFPVLSQTNQDIPTNLSKKYLELISKRQIGQTKFAVKQDYYQTEQQQEQRDIQESDVYKLGKSGEKELFLLNNFRGFQVISFKEGLKIPKILGRLPIYNNWSSEMYFLAAQNQVIIMNTEWEASENDWSSHYNTVLYLVDVSVSSRPSILKEMKIPGYLQQSRMVGNVLYTITKNFESNSEALITSVKLDGSLKQIDTMKLESSKRWISEMNVVKSGDKYYVLAAQTSWNIQGDLISIFDITDAGGKIRKVMTAKARGEVSERSNIFLHRGHLFAVTNWRKDETSPSRISVEGFPLRPSTTIQVSKESLRVSVGDTTGLHASLQDVRISGDHLYAFWVPANNIDPFELFDLSAPEKGIIHLGQLQFDGWISRAFPVDVNGRKFVIGLGWVVPSTNEDGKRYPQAKIFEIKNDHGRIRHEVVSSLTLDIDVWASLNGEDKSIEMISEAPGEYQILFPVMFRDGYKDGAKVVVADMNKLSLSEGASMIANQSWLRRVFVNPEVRALNAFSDEELETYDQSAMGRSGVAKVVSILELARNIVDFHQLSDDVGFQIVKKDEHMELRKVSLTDVDAELNEVQEVITIKGRYGWHKAQDEKLLVVTAFFRKETRGNDDYRYQAEVFDHGIFSVINLATGVRSEQKFHATDVDDYWFEVSATPSVNGDILSIGSDLFLVADSSLSKLSVSADCQYFLDNENRNYSIHGVGGDLYAYNEFEVSASDDADAYYNLPFVKKLAISGEQLTCSKSISVPGKPVMRDREYLVTSDSQDFGMVICYEYGGHSDFDFSSKTYSLKLTSSSATLVDVLEKDITAGVFENSLVTYSSKEKRVDVWKLGSSGEFLSRPLFLRHYDLNSNLITTASLGDKEYVFLRNDKLIDVFEINDSGRLSQIPITTKWDLNKEDGSAEYIFAIDGLGIKRDHSRFYFSQGMYGLGEVVIK